MDEIDRRDEGHPDKIAEGVKGAAAMAEAAEESKPDPEAIEIKQDADAFRRMDLEDERQILDELQGRALDVMLYSFEMDGSKKTGLSWKGSREAVRTLNARGYTEIRMTTEVKPEFEEVKADGKDAIRCVVYAEDTKNGGGNWGVAVQPKMMKLRGGKEKPDPFAVHKALSKAQRNSYEALIPLEAIEYLKAQYLGRPDQVKVIPGAGRAVELEAPPPLDDEAAKEKLAKMRSLYDEIKSLDRIVMPPGQFNAIVMASQHDHERMDEAVEHLASFRDGEIEITAAREKYRLTVPSETFDLEAQKMLGLSQQRRLARWRELLGKVEK